MPPTSAARLRRKRRGLEPEKKPDPAISAKRRAAAAARWAKEQGVDEAEKRRKLEALAKQRAGGEMVKPRGWLPASAEKRLDEAYLQRVLENQQTVTSGVLQMAVEFAPEAMQNLVDLARNAGNESVRRLASLDILNIAGATVDGKGAGIERKPLQEMTSQELRSFIVTGKAALARLQNEVETVQ